MAKKISVIRTYSKEKITVIYNRGRTAVLRELGIQRAPLELWLCHSLAVRPQSLFLHSLICEMRVGLVPSKALSSCIYSMKCCVYALMYIHRLILLSSDGSIRYFSGCGGHLMSVHFKKQLST